VHVMSSDSVIKTPAEFYSLAGLALSPGGMTKRRVAIEWVQNKTVRKLEPNRFALTGEPDLFFSASPQTLERRP
jgi:hypothetical protein